MFSIRQWIFCTFLGLIWRVTFAQEACSSSQHQNAINSLFRDKKFTIWESIEFDFNGDGVQDLAAVLTHYPERTEREERLVVLFGKANCEYSSASISSDYCITRYHYNLEAGKNSLFVTGFSNIRGSYHSLQFRFNHKRNDMELIGETIFDADDQYDFQYGKKSINYLTGHVQLSKKSNGKLVEKSEKMNRYQTHMLNGFLCYGDR